MLAPMHGEQNIAKNYFYRVRPIAEFDNATMHAGAVLLFA